MEVSGERPVTTVDWSRTDSRSMHRAPRGGGRLGDARGGRRGELFAACSLSSRTEHDRSHLWPGRLAWGQESNQTLAMRKQQAMAALREQSDAVKALGATSLYLFGSMVR